MNLWSNDSSNLKSCRCSNPYIHNNQQIIWVSPSQSRRWCLDLRLLLHSPSCSPQSRSPASENTGNIQHWRFIPAGQKQNFPQLRRKDGSSQLWLCRLLPLSGGGCSQFELPVDWLVLIYLHTVRNQAAPTDAPLICSCTQTSNKIFTTRIT